MSFESRHVPEGCLKETHMEGCQNCGQHRGCHFHDTYPKMYGTQQGNQNFDNLP